ncbi:hypothetical protein [Jatrophihabitans sp.]|uniref:hypothetical protein n=1 Tax=Jatrophihabitans sp. TaxID=1932789 RepID=UPI0030C70969
MTAPAAGGQATHNMQGIAVPASSVNPPLFFAKTRRHTLKEKAVSFASSLTGGSQNQDVFELRKSDILASVMVKFSGTLVVTGGTTNVSMRWPYDLLRAKFTANGASNVINAGGSQLKVREVMKRGDFNDRGVSQSLRGATVNQGSLASAAESWGVGAGASAIAAGSYNVELYWIVPVAEDEIDLSGGVFLATSTADLTLSLDWLPMNQLFSGGSATNVALTGTTTVVSKKFSIPIGTDGEIVIPDLSVFHSIISTRSTDIQNGKNEIRVLGQGGGKSLLRSWFQVWSGAGTAASPLAMNATNFGEQAWRYGNNETPDVFPDGQYLRELNERHFCCDIGGQWGFGCHDFASELEFRDAVDMSTTSDLRLLVDIPAGVSLTTPAIEYVTETIYTAGAAA